MARIKVTRGGCGIQYTDASGNARHALKTPEHGPFECDDAQAERLVELGVAEYVGLQWRQVADPEPEPDTGDGSQDPDAQQGDTVDDAQDPDAQQGDTGDGSQDPDAQQGDTGDDSQDPAPQPDAQQGDTGDGSQDPAPQPDAQQGDTGDLDAAQLETMTIEQLKNLAGDLGIDVTGCKKKADYIAAIVADNDPPDLSAADPV